jgi:Tfp pilus assembly major pilin PilA
MEIFVLIVAIIAGLNVYMYQHYANRGGVTYSTLYCQWEAVTNGIFCLLALSFLLTN